MDWIIEPERQTPIVADVDLLVCGGGIAGVSAALCAARNGVICTACWGTSLRLNMHKVANSALNSILADLKKSLLI